jgi:hypothetical protein
MGGDLTGGGGRIGSTESKFIRQNCGCIMLSGLLVESAKVIIDILSDCAATGDGCNTVIIIIGIRGGAFCTIDVLHQSSQIIVIMTIIFAVPPLRNDHNKVNFDGILLHTPHH